MAPVSWNGSQILYRHVVRPFFLKHEATVDGMVNDISGKAMTAAEKATREGIQHKTVSFLRFFKTPLISIIFIKGKTSKA